MPLAMLLLVRIPDEATGGRDVLLFGHGIGGRRAHVAVPADQDRSAAKICRKGTGSIGKPFCRLVDSSAPGHIFFPGEAVDITLAFKDAPADCSIEVRGIHIGVPDKQAAYMPNPGERHSFSPTAAK